MAYRLDGLKIYQGVKLIATAANIAAARQLMHELNGDTGYIARVHQKLTEQDIYD